MYLSSSPSFQTCVQSSEPDNPIPQPRGNNSDKPVSENKKRYVNLIAVC